MDTPEFFQTSHYTAAQFATEKRLPADKNIDQFIIDDLLDFPTDEAMVVGPDSSVFDPITAATSTDSSSLLDNSCNSSFSDLHAAGIVAPGDGPFASELCVPYDDMAELEWLSNMVDESFCSEDLQKLHLIQPQGMNKARVDEPRHETIATTLPSEMLVPAKARSKRSRAAPGNWTSRLIATSSSPTAGSQEPAAAAQKKKEAPGENSSPVGEGTRRCLHCATDKTPQWRTGPMGPKTLCNACGVRYKSGRLVPEYRPAASPTFVLTKHSNSHRKVLELRRQKEAQQRAQQQFLQHHHHHHHQNMIFDHVSNGEDYLIHQHIGPDYRQLI